MSAIVAKCLIDINKTLEKMNTLMLADVSNIGSWKDVQSIVRRGLAKEIFPLGTIFGVDRGGTTYYFEVVAHNHYNVGSNYSMTLLSNTSFCNANFNRASCFFYTQPNNDVYVRIPKDIVHTNATWSQGYYLVPKDYDAATAEGAHKTVCSIISNINYSDPFNKAFDSQSLITSIAKGTFSSNAIRAVSNPVNPEGETYETVTEENMYDYVCGRIDYNKAFADIILNQEASILGSDIIQYGDGAQAVNYTSVASNRESGFLSGLDAGFIDVVGKTPITCQKKDGKVETIGRQFFIASATELGHDVITNSTATVELGTAFELFEKTGAHLFNTSGMTRTVSVGTHKNIYTVSKTSTNVNKLKQCFPAEDYEYIYPCCTIY